MLSFACHCHETGLIPVLFYIEKRACTQKFKKNNRVSLTSSFGRLTRPDTRYPAGLTGVRRVN